MKRTIIVLIVLFSMVSVSGCKDYKLFSSKSEKIERKMEMMQKEPGFNKYIYDIQKSQLVSALIDEEKYDRAIKVIEEQIQDNRVDGEAYKSRAGRLDSSFYKVEAAEYRQIEFCYSQKKDLISAEKARKKAEELEAAAKRAEKSEPVK